MEKRRPLEAGLVILVLLVAALIRLYGLDRLSLWSDELWVVIVSSTGSLWDMLGNVYINDNHPPGYYLFSRFTQGLLGNSDFAIRFPSALAGILLVWSVWHIGRQYLPWRAAVIAAALVVANYQLVYYSQEARPNIFVALFALWALHAFIKKQVLLFAIAATICMYLHYAGLVFVLCLVPVQLFLLARHPTRAALKQAVLLFALPALLFLPWLPGMVHDLLHSPPEYWQRKPSLQTLDQLFWFLFGPDSLFIWFYRISALFVLLFLVNSARKRTLLLPGFLVLLLVMAILPLAVFLVKSLLSQSAYNHRHFLFVIPFAALMAGWMLDQLLQRLSSKRQTAALIAIVCLLPGYQLAVNWQSGFYRANHFKQEYREVGALVASDEAFMNHPRVLVVANLFFFDHYLKRFGARRVTEAIYDKDEQIDEIRQILTAQQVEQFYFLEAPMIPGQNNMVTKKDLLLAEHYTPLCRTRFQRAQAIKWTTTPAANPGWETLPACP